jgi:hypothetical protein
LPPEVAPGATPGISGMEVALALLEKNNAEIKKNKNRKEIQKSEIIQDIYLLIYAA